MRRAVLPYFLLFGLLLTLPHQAHAQGQTIAEVIAVLEAAATAIESNNPDEAAQLLGTLQTVSLPDGERLELVASGWHEVLEQPPAVAAATLRSLAQRLESPPGSLPADSRARLEEVLARPEFQDAQPTLLQRFLRWLSELLPDASPDAQILFDLGVGLFGILVISALGFFVVRLVRRNWREGEALEALGNIPVDASEAQQKASEAAVAGNLREAMRLLYIAALLHLDEVGLLRFDRALTNREVLATVADRAPLHNALAPVVAQFDRVWYGHAPFDEGDFARMEKQIEALRQMQGTVKQ